MTFQLVCIEPKELTQYKSDMQEAFQKGFEDVFGKTDAVILPEKDIDQSLNAEGSAVYKAVVDGEMVGGAVVIINESTQHNHLDLLFVKNGVQSNGIGKKIWFELERIYPKRTLGTFLLPYGVSPLAHLINYPVQNFPVKVDLMSSSGKRSLPPASAFPDRSKIRPCKIPA